MKNLFRKIILFWNQERSLNVVLVILALYIFVFVPLLSINRWGQILIRITYSLLLVAAILSVARNKKYVYLIGFWAVLSLIINWLEEFEKTQAVLFAQDVGAIFFNLCFAAVLLVKTFSGGEITYHRILGAIIVMLVTGLIFSYAFHAIYLLEGKNSFNNIADADLKEFIYFSFTTLTTVGYGDITPVAPLARSFANLETLIGQLYPAILIARLVSMEFEASSKKKNSQ